MTRRIKQRHDQSNSGIQANNVTADVLAVGTGATATKIVNQAAIDRELPDLVEKLRAALDRLSLQPPARAELEADVNRLQKAAVEKERNPDRINGILESIKGKLKMVGVIAGQALEIAEPLKKIAGLFGLSLPW